MSIKSEKPNETQKVPVWFTYGTLGIILALIGMMTVFITNSKNRNILSLNTISRINNALIRLDTQTSRFIIKSSIPMLEKNAGEEDPFTLLHINWSELYWRMVANIRNTSPQEILATQFPFLVFMKPRVIPLKEIPNLTQPELPQLSDSLPNQPVISSEPVILIYHTHTSESYIPVSGEDHQLNQKGDIVKVGEHLQQVLEEKYGIRSIHSEDINDQFPFRESYTRAQGTVLKYLKEYPSIKVVLDVHRDATPGIETICNLNGEKTATLRIVVGSNKMGLEHPNWRKNLEFATKLTENMNLYYPGLSHNILISEARYNQHLHDHALLVEFGDYQNSTLDELYRSAERFAEILTFTLNKEKE